MATRNTLIRREFHSVMVFVCNLKICLDLKMCSGDTLCSILKDINVAETHVIITYELMLMLPPSDYAGTLADVDRHDIQIC